MAISTPTSHARSCPIVTFPSLSPPQPAKSKENGKKKRRKHAVNEDQLDEDLDEDMAEDSDSDEEGGAGAEDEDSPESRKLEQAYLLKGLQAAQLADLVDATASSAAQRASLTRLELDIDKTLLQLLAIECREGEDRGMRALELSHAHA